MTYEVTRLQNSHSQPAGEKIEFMHDNELWGFLYVLAGEDPTQELTPHPESDLGITYRVDGVSVPADRIKRLAEKSLLDIAGVMSFACCPQCNSMRLLTMMKCPNCHKQTLSKSELVIHYECGHLAPLSEIMVPGTNDYVCSSCGKRMKRVGIDYGRPGLGFRCLSCGEVSQYPQLLLTCGHGHEFRIDEQELRVFPIYKLGKALQTMPRIMGFLTAIKEELARNDAESVVLAQVAGASGTTYIASIMIPSIPPILTDFVLDESSWEFQVLQTIKKSADLNARTLLLVRSDLCAMAKEMVNPDRIRVISFEDEAMIPELATKALLEMRSNPTPLPKANYQAYVDTAARKEEN